MAAEKDPSDWLPTPPPPRPARRDASIEAAMRKFDGVEETPPARQADRSGWARTHRTQLSIVFSALLLVIVGIPAALIGIRNQPTGTEQSVRPPAVRISQPKRPSAKPVAPAEAQDMVVAPLPQSVAPPALRKNRGDEAAGAARNQVATGKIAVAEGVPAPVAAASPPPPAPPPPPPVQAEVARADQAASQEMVVTGSRVDERARRQIAAPERGFMLAPKASAPSFQGAFLAQLQAAIRANDRATIIRMIGFPLRVNHHERSKVYRDASSVSRDFDRIFTSHVRRAILEQRPEQLFSRDVGTMIGNGELWFDRSCADAKCTALGPARIIAVNP